MIKSQLNNFMLTYKEYRRKLFENEAGPLESIYREIDVIFEDIKKLVTDMTTPRGDHIDAIRSYISKAYQNSKQEHTLRDYIILKKYVSELNEAVNTAGGNLDSVLDQYRDKLKSIIADNFAVQSAPVAPESPLVEPKAAMPVQEPAAVSKANPKDLELMKLGSAIFVARQLLDKEDVTPDELKQVIQGSTPGEFDPASHMEYKDELISLAKDYLSKNAGEKKAEAPQEPEREPTEDELMEMPDVEFRKFIKRHDPELAGSYSGERWWGKRMRQELVLSYLQTKNLAAGRYESLDYSINKYKDYLRASNRPKFFKEIKTMSSTDEKIKFLKENLKSGG